MNERMPGFLPYSNEMAINGLHTDASRLELGDSIEKALLRFETLHNETFQHGQRTGNFAKLLAKEIGLLQDEQNLIYLAGLLHDVGKLFDVLWVNGALSEGEKECVASQNHAALGADVLEGMNFPSEIVELVRHHHDRFLPDKTMPLPTQIVVAADRFDAIQSDRYYSKGTSPEHALARLSNLYGIHFDGNLKKPLENVVTTFFL